MDDFPEGVLPIVLSFLPAHDAVRTSALARRWRHLWTCAPALRITAVRGFGSADKFNNFVDRLLSLRRDGGPLESCEFDLDENDIGFDWFPSAQHVFHWSLQSALSCNVRALRFRFTKKTHRSDFPHDLPEPPEPLLSSQHLSRLELHSIPSSLDFEGCPVLVDLKMESCITYSFDVSPPLAGKKLSSPSLQRLSMTRCVFCLHYRTPTSLPSLVRLKLIDCFGRLPLLENLPSLETAIRLGAYSEDSCLKSASSGCPNDDPCGGCRFYHEFEADCKSGYFFQGLSRATHLELSAYYDDALIFQRDLKWCPTFPMLKTLILDDWCLDADLSAVILFIQHSPNLEKLTLELVEEFDSSMVTEGSNNPVQGTFASDHLKMVEIKCDTVDGRIHKILKILSSCGISLEKINIRQTNTSS